MTDKKISSITDEIFELYEKHGSNEYAGEKISQLEHMVQAAQLAKQAGYDDEIVLAAFLHDIGHICAASYITAGMNGFCIPNLFFIQVTFGIFIQLLRKNEQTVQRGSELMRHVRQKLGFILGGQRQLFGFFFQ